jgi:hypothetical protein
MRGRRGVRAGSKGESSPYDEHIPCCFLAGTCCDDDMIIAAGKKKIQRPEERGPLSL